MPYTPLTEDQFKKALNSGFTANQIIQFEKRRKQQEDKVTNNHAALFQQLQSQSIEQPNVVGNVADKIANKVTNIPVVGGVASGLAAVTSGAAKGVASTLTGIGKLASQTGQAGLLMKPEQRQTIQQAQPPSPQGTGEEIGFGTEQLGEFFIPSGTIMKATKLLKAAPIATKLVGAGKVGRLTETAITRGLPEAIGAAGVTAAQTGGDSGTITRNGIIAGVIPIVGKGLSILGELKPQGLVREITTGVPKETFQRVSQMPQVYDDALQHLAENPQQPFLGLAQSISNKLLELKSNALKAYTEAVDFTKTKFPDTTFSLENKIPELNKTLNRFNLAVSQARDKSGKLTSTGTVKATTRTSPYTSQEIQSVNELVRKMRVKDMSVDELLDFSESVKNFLGDAVQRDNKKMVKLGMSLLEDSTRFVDEVFPQLKNANNQYRAYYKALDSYGNKIVDNTGALKDTAEQFLSNIANLNKGEQRDAIKVLERVTGIPILDNVTILKDAQKLTYLFPQTGSRTLDILRSLAVRGAAIGGGAFGGVPGFLGGAALTGLSSPRVVGKAAINAAKVGQKITQKTPEIIKETIRRALPGSKY